MSIFQPQKRINSLSGQITIAMYRISQAIGHLFRIQGTKHQLSPAQIQTLLFLRYTRPGVRTIGGLAARLTSSYATTSGVVDALESKNLVERKPLPEDQRTVVLRLTERGDQKTDQIENVLDEVESAINELPLNEQEALIHGLQTIVRHLQASGHVQVYEMCWDCQFFRLNQHPEQTGSPHHCAFVDAPLPEANTYFECPDFVAKGLL
jgi:DNA-binding MarR family transcriptional regulator